MRPSLTVGLCLLALTIVQSSLVGQVTGRHPNPAYITPAPKTAAVAFGAAVHTVPPNAHVAIIATLGSEDGPAATLFGRINQAAFLDDSTVAVIDGTTPEVRLFSVTGRHLQTIGRKGEGPGEFRAPQAVARSPVGELLISDIRRNIQVFRRGPRGFEHRQTLSLPFSPRSMCFLGQRLFVNAPIMGKPEVIHELTTAGTVLRSFGDSYRSPNSLVNYEAGQGRIVCDSRRQLLYLMAGGILGEVRAFRPTGELVWRVHISDFRTNIVIDEPDGLRVERSTMGAHASVGLALVESLGLVAMWSFTTQAQMNAKESPTQTQLVLIEPATGKSASLGRWPTVMTDVRGSLELNVSHEPFPRIDVRRAGIPRKAP